MTFPSFVQPDVPELIRILRESHGIRCLIMIPLKVDQRPIGILALADRATREIGESDLPAAGPGRILGRYQGLELPMPQLPENRRMRRLRSPVLTFS